MLKTASLICKSEWTPDEVVWQAQHFDIMLADGAMPHAIGKKALAYGQPTIRDNSWTKWLDEYGWKEWVVKSQADGLFIDTPFIDFDIERIKAIAAAVAPYPIIPNYGDFGTWTRSAPAAPAYKLWSEQIEAISKWACVQNAVDMRFFTESMWRNVRAAANTRLAAGRSLILGIYDPARQHERLAAVLTHSFEHRNLYWSYCTDETSVKLDDNWNEDWKWAR